MNRQSVDSANSSGAMLRQEAREIFASALQESSIPAAFARHLRVDAENNLHIAPPAGGNPFSISLYRYTEICVVALGKAAAPMLESLLALLEPLPKAIPLRGVCCAPSIPGKLHPGIVSYAGGHPWPNRDSLRAAHATLDLLGSAGRGTLVLFLVSGGGSSLFEAPLDPEISLDETIAFYKVLVGSGATIAEINTVRKHFSAVKGGRLAFAAGHASQLSLLVSDVPEGRLDALASGPTLPDTSTVAECREILDRHRLLQDFPPRVRGFFLNSSLPETPRSLAAAPSIVLASNRELLEAARRQAELRGWHTEIDNGCDDWDYRDAVSYLLERLRRLRQRHGRVCLLSGGEITVRLEGTPGAGGRNQQFALASALEIARDPALSRAPLAVLSAGSDGVDGVSDAAGAVIDAATIARARAMGLDAEGALLRFDAFPLFRALGDAVLTGPTGNNLRDLRILLSDSEKALASGR
jgi:hydroxypyruvate reductase